MPENDHHSSDNLNETLARMDERTKNIEHRIGELVSTFNDFRIDINEKYIERVEFKSLAEKVNLHQQILFGTIGLICFAVLGALVTLVIRHGY